MALTVVEMTLRTWFCNFDNSLTNIDNICLPTVRPLNRPHDSASNGKHLIEMGFLVKLPNTLEAP